MESTVTKFKWFIITDYEEEEQWLREQHKNGLKLKSVRFCVFTFEKCEPEDVIYRLEYDPNPLAPDYEQMLKDYGWEYFAEYNRFKYFRKPASEAQNEKEAELFSDNESRLAMLSKVTTTRLAPIIVIFLTCVIPGFRNAFTGTGRIAMLSIYTLLLVLYLWILIHCAIKITKLKKKYQKN